MEYARRAREEKQEPQTNGGQRCQTYRKENRPGTGANISTEEVALDFDWSRGAWKGNLGGFSIHLIYLDTSTSNLLSPRVPDRRKACFVPSPGAHNPTIHIFIYSCNEHLPNPNLLSRTVYYENIFPISN